MRCWKSVRSFTAELGRDDSLAMQKQASKDAPIDSDTKLRSDVSRSWREAGEVRPLIATWYNTNPQVGADGHSFLPTNKPLGAITPSSAVQGVQQIGASWRPSAQGNTIPLVGDCPYEIVVVGTSLGGLHALEILLAGLPKNFPLPVAIAQHRHKTSDDSLSFFLQRQCVLPLVEAEDKDVIVPGSVYLAPADYHLLVEAGSAQGHRPYFALSTEAPVCYARPSINVLFESAADAYGEKAIGVILTGASNDGTQGLAKIKAYGGLAIVQEPSTAESPTMPKAAIASVATDWIVPLGDIAPLIVHLCHPALR